jgi:hypothetical protein
MWSPGLLTQSPDLVGRYADLDDDLASTTAVLGVDTARFVPRR